MQGMSMSKLWSHQFLLNISYSQTPVRPDMYFSIVGILLLKLAWGAGTDVFRERMGLVDNALPSTGLNSSMAKALQREQFIS